MQVRALVNDAPRFTKRPHTAIGIWTGHLEKRATTTVGREWKTCDDNCFSAPWLGWCLQLALVGEPVAHCFEGWLDINLQRGNCSG